MPDRLIELTGNTLMIEVLMGLSVLPLLLPAFPCGP